MKKKVSVLCNGCPESRLDNTNLRDCITSNGYNVVSDYTIADLIIFRACGLTELNADFSIEIIKNLSKNKKKESKIIVWGCLPKIDPNKLGVLKDDITIYETESEILNNVFNIDDEFNNVYSNHPSEIYNYEGVKKKNFKGKIYDYLSNYFSIMNPNKKIYYIKIANGCMHSCTFCAIKKSRGKLKSYNEDKILSQFKEGIEKGYKYFGLLGTDVGSYGKDKGSNIINLLNRMCDVEGDFKIGLRNFYPDDLITHFDELIPLFESGKIWFIVSSIQTGSERILHKMGRKYDIEKFKHYVKYLNRNHPEIIIRTQIIVGFPSETDDDFKQSMKMLDEIYFDWVEVFMFSSRPGTLAASMADQVSENSKKERANKMMLKTFLQKPMKKIVTYIKVRAQ